MSGKTRMISILLTEYTDPFSRVMRIITRCRYTHASIGIGEEFTEFYSFNTKRGFCIENLLRKKRCELCSLSTECLLVKNISTVLGEEFDKDSADIDRQLADLQNELIKQANSKEDYDAVVDEIYRLRGEKQEALVHNAERQTKRQRIAEMTEFLEEQTEMIEYDDKLVRQLVEKVLIHENKWIVTFKSGLEIEVMI